MGRKGKKRPSTSDDYRLRRQQQQQNQRSALLSSNGGNQVVMNADDNDDDDVNAAEIHITSHWDEHPHHEPEEEDKNILSIYSEFQCVAQSANDHLKDSSHLMEEMFALREKMTTKLSLLSLI